MSQVDLYVLNISFPKAAKMRTMFRDELPLDMLVSRIVISLAVSQENQLVLEALGKHRQSSFHCHTK